MEFKARENIIGYITAEKNPTAGKATNAIGPDIYNAAIKETIVRQVNNFNTTFILLNQKTSHVYLI